MALKYSIEYKDVDNNEYRIEISSSAYAGAEIPVNGRCTIEYPEVKDILEPIKGIGCKIEFEASIGQDFLDLWTEEDKIYTVNVKKNATLNLFDGFISPEGIYQDWVSDRWLLTIDCLSHLSYLENLSYVDAAGLFYQGKQKCKDIIINCLKRAGNTLNVNMRVNRHYVGWDSGTDSKNILGSTYLNANRFVREDDKTIMDCKEVLESVLKMFSATITYYDGAYYVYSPLRIAEIAEGQDFHAYDYLGTKLVSNVNIDTTKEIGSHINAASIFHCNGNQRLEMKSTLAAVRIKYKYGLVEGLFVNPKFDYIGGVIEGWTILDATKLASSAHPTTGKTSARISSYRGKDGVYAGDTPAAVLVSDAIAVEAGIQLTFALDVYFNKFINAQVVKIFLDDGVDVYYFHVDDGWVLGGADPGYVYLQGESNNNAESNTFEIKTPPAIVAGDIKFYIMQPRDYVAAVQYTWIEGFRAYPEGSDINGETHTVLRTLNASNKVKDVIEMDNGDNPSNAYFGTIYKEDTITPTEFWDRDGQVVNYPILRLVAEEYLILNSTPTKIFSGDVYGYLPYLTKVSISGITGIFMVTSYVYDTYNNVTSLVLTEIKKTALAGQTYEFALDYGKTVEPTIKG